jgi:nucleoside-diphosphate-sugar epimerase
VLDELRAGRARCVAKRGHAFGRIHRDDIARAVLAAIGSARPGAVRIFNLADDEPAESAAVLAHAAGLLGLPPPLPVPFAAAVATMSPMARSFWADNRKVASAATQAALGIGWRYPSYREGLAGILAEERGQGLAEERQIRLP